MNENEVHCRREQKYGEGASPHGGLGPTKGALPRFSRGIKSESNGLTELLRQERAVDALQQFDAVSKFVDVRTLQLEQAGPFPQDR
jgi:hypothetical protein